MIFSGIMAGLGAAASIGGGIFNAIKANKERERAAEEAKRRQAHYEAKAAENPLARSENQALLAKYDRDAKKQVDAARNTAAIMGATPEQAVAVQDAVAQGKADLMGQIAATSSARADKYNELAERAAEQGADIQREYDSQQQESIANGITNTLNSVSNMTNAISTPKTSVAPEPSAPSMAPANPIGQNDAKNATAMPKFDADGRIKSGMVLADTQLKATLSPLQSGYNDVMKLRINKRTL